MTNSPLRDVHKRRLAKMTPLQVLTEAERRGYRVHYPGDDRNDTLFATILGDSGDNWCRAANDRIALFLIEVVRPVRLADGRVIHVSMEPQP